MRKIHPGNVHPVFNKLQKNLRGPTDGPNGANNAGQSHLVGSGVHVQVRDILNVGAGLPGLLLSGRNVKVLQDGLKQSTISDKHDK